MPPKQPRKPAPGSRATPPIQGELGWQQHPTVEPSAGSAKAVGAEAAGPSAVAPAAPAPAPERDLTLAVEVEPRKPRLAWQGMDRRELAVSVPTQVVEIVWPGRAIRREGELSVDTRAVVQRDTTTLPPNRLIWTNDNLVALQTLLDERDPMTRDYRYRGKVDLVYIDPPFMVNNDFLADNAIDIELDDDAGVQAKKEPSLVEILAYKDTWRQGLDSFLSMLKRRLELLKQLLAPTGSIYVHLDWHAVHYVKVLMDELFGYDNFCNEIVWRRSLPHGNVDYKFGASHDTILLYANGPNATWHPLFTPHRAEYLRDFYKFKESDGRVYRLISCINPNPNRPNLTYEWNGVTKVWKYSRDRMQRMHDEGLLVYSKNGTPSYKGYLEDMDGVPMQDIWTDIAPLMGSSNEWTTYPTQKPVTLLERILTASSEPGGIVLDAFMGSGTTCEAAERLGRRFIGIDNGKYAIHLARKRLIQLHGQPRPPEKAQYDYVECSHCKNIERKEKPQKGPGPFQVRPFTVENMGVYQRAEQWQSFQTQRCAYRDEMIKVFGGEPVSGYTRLHGKKGQHWIHVGPLDGTVSIGQVWHIAREAQRTDLNAVTILSADFDTLSGGEKSEVEDQTGIHVTVRAIPAQAIDEVRRRIDGLRKNPDAPVESMAIPAFYAPLSIVLDARVSGRRVTLALRHCEVDIESFVASQRPALSPITERMSAAARKKAEAEQAKWAARQRDLEKWLQKATSWQKFVDFWSVDWNYGRRVGPDGKPIFETDWQSFRVRRGKSDLDPLVFESDFQYAQAGRFQVAARVTDVFGNDGIATVGVDVK